MSLVLLLEKAEGNLLNIPKIQLISRRFQRPGLLKTAILAILLTAVDSQIILVPQSDAYAETGQEIGNGIEHSNCGKIR